MKFFNETSKNRFPSLLVIYSYKLWYLWSLVICKTYRVYITQACFIHTFYLLTYIYYILLVMIFIAYEIFLKHEIFFS